MQAETDTARPAIEAQLARFSRGAAFGNPDTMLAIYAPGAILMPPNLPAMDLAGARERYAAVGPYQVSFATRTLEVHGASAIERGIWSAVMSPPGSEWAVLRDGKYMAHWRKVDGQWLIVEHIWNDDFPPPM
jgi:ketosteroid isomerase-like protein